MRRCIEVDRRTFRTVRRTSTWRATRDVWHELSQSRESPLKTKKIGAVRKSSTWRAARHFQHKTCPSRFKQYYSKLLYISTFALLFAVADAALPCTGDSKATARDTERPSKEGNLCSAALDKLRA